MMLIKNKTAKELLQPDPFLEFYEEQHKYYDLKKKHIVPRSISDLKGKLEYRNANIEEGIRRGNAVHKACNIYAESKDKTLALVCAGKYRQYVENFINAGFWINWEVIVSEFALVDRLHDIAGTLDLILQNKNNGQIILVDIKTGNKQNFKVQLGGYVNLLYKNFPDIKIDFCSIFYVWKDELKRVREETDECLEEYENCKDLYFKKSLSW